MTPTTPSTPNDPTTAAAADRLSEELDAAIARVDALEAEYRALLADPGVIQEDRDAQRVLLTSARESLAITRAAFELIGTGDYGRCERCGEPIAPERLEAIPDALRCVECSI